MKPVVSVTILYLEDLGGLGGHIVGFAMLICDPIWAQVYLKFSSSYRRDVKFRDFGASLLLSSDLLK